MTTRRKDELAGVAVRRALVLGALSAGGWMSLRDIAWKAGTKPLATIGHLRSFVREGLAEHEPARDGLKSRWRLKA